MKKPIQEKSGISETKYRKNFFFDFCENMSSCLYILFLGIYTSRPWPFAWPPVLTLALAPNLYLPVLAPNLYLPTLSSNLYLSPGPQFLFTGPDPRFVFTGPGPKFVILVSLECSLRFKIFEKKSCGFAVLVCCAVEN